MNLKIGDTVSGAIKSTELVLAKAQRAITSSRKSMRRRLFFRSLGMAIVALSVLARAGSAQNSPAPAQLKIGGAVSTPLTLDLAELKSMPRATLHVMNSHEKKAETYEGVFLSELLQKAGVPHGESIRGPLMTTYIIAEGEDGYRVVFSLAELDSGFVDSEVLVADTKDGAPLGANQGPFKLVAPHDKRPARWVRTLRSITVVTP